MPSHGLPPRALCLALLLPLLSACATGDQVAARGQHTLACVNALLETDAAMPDVVVMKRSEFAERFGAQYDGYYVGREQRVYLSSRGNGTLLAHELAHHARVASGGRINEREAEQAAQRCSDGGKGWRG